MSAFVAPEPHRSRCAGREEQPWVCLSLWVNIGRVVAQENRGPWTISSCVLCTIDPSHCALHLQTFQEFFTGRTRHVWQQHSKGRLHTERTVDLNCPLVREIGR